MPASVDELTALIRRLQAQMRAQQAQIDQAHAALLHERAQHAAEVTHLREEIIRIQEEAAAEAVRLREELAQERQAHAATKASLQQLLDALGTLDERFKALLRRQYANSSERACADQLMIPELLRELEDLQAVEAVDAARAAAGANDDATTDDDAGVDDTHRSASTDKRRKRPPKAGGRKPLPADIPREAITYEPPKNHPALKHALSAERIGSTLVERWHITPATVVVQAITCPILRLKLKGGITTQHTCTPPAVIDRGQVSDDFLVHSAVDKVQDHLPAYRQEARLARAGALIPRSKLTRWHRELGQFLTPLSEAILDEIRLSPAVGIDDTVHREIQPNRRVCLQGRLWVVSSPAGIFYQYQPTREAQWIEALLANYTGAVMGDAYSGHSGLLARRDIMAAFCWAHARRKFFESADKRRRQIMLDHIGRLYAIEDDLRDQPPNAIAAERRRRGEPILAQIKELLTSWDADPRVLPKSGIGNATRYVLARWDGFTAYLDHGHIPIDNNRTERGMRPNALHRKNSLFSASRAGAEAYATLLTVTQTAWMHSLDPASYLLDVINRLHHADAKDSLDHLTPSAYAAEGKYLVKKPS